MSSCEAVLLVCSNGTQTYCRKAAVVRMFMLQRPNKAHQEQGYLPSLRATTRPLPGSETICCCLHAAIIGSDLSATQTLVPFTRRSSCISARSPSKCEGCVLSKRRPRDVTGQATVGEKPATFFRHERFLLSQLFFLSPYFAWQ